MTAAHHQSSTNAAVRAKYESEAVHILENIMRRQNYRSIVRDEISHCIAITVDRETRKLRQKLERLERKQMGRV